MTTADDAESALTILYRDCLEIYERARTEVTNMKSDGTQQRYAPVRYKQQIERAYEANELVPAIARIVRRPTTGFQHLEEAGRPDLMLEHSFSTRRSPYHQLFLPRTVALAHQR